MSIIRNGTVIHTFHPKTYFLDFAHDDTQELSKILLPGGEEKSPFVYYYLRVVQEDGHMDGPLLIWIDDTEATNLSLASKKPKKK